MTKRIINTNQDYRKLKLLEAVTKLPANQQEMVEKVIYDQYDNLDEDIIENLKLLTSTRFLNAVELKEQLASCYLNSITTQNKKLSLQRLLEKFKVTTAELNDIVNLKLIKLGKSIVDYKENSDASLIELFLTKTQSKILLEYCILDRDPSKIELPKKAVRSEEITNQSITDYVEEISKNITQSQLIANYYHK